MEKGVKQEMNDLKDQLAGLIDLITKGKTVAEEDDCPAIGIDLSEKEEPLYPSGLTPPQRLYPRLPIAGIVICNLTTTGSPAIDYLYSPATTSS